MAEKAIVTEGEFLLALQASWSIVRCRRKVLCRWSGENILPSNARGRLPSHFVKADQTRWCRALSIGYIRASRRSRFDRPCSEIAGGATGTCLGMCHCHSNNIFCSSSTILRTSTRTKQKPVCCRLAHHATILEMAVENCRRKIAIKCNTAMADRQRKRQSNPVLIDAFAPRLSSDIRDGNAFRSVIGRPNNSGPFRTAKQELALSGRTDPARH